MRCHSSNFECNYQTYTYCCAVLLCDLDMMDREFQDILHTLIPSWFFPAYSYLGVLFLQLKGSELIFRPKSTLFPLAILSVYSLIVFPFYMTGILNDWKSVSRMIGTIFNQLTNFAEFALSIVATIWCCKYGQPGQIFSNLVKIEKFFIFKKIQDLKRNNLADVLTLGYYGFLLVNIAYVLSVKRPLSPEIKIQDLYLMCHFHIFSYELILMRIALLIRTSFRVLNRHVKYCYLELREDEPDVQASKENTLTGKQILV